MRIAEKLQTAINSQIAVELWTANLYRSMAYYFDYVGYQGFARWMRCQSDEEVSHADKMASFMAKRDAQAHINLLREVPHEWETPLEVFEQVHHNEWEVSKLIDKLLDLAIEENDRAVQDFLWDFVSEQVEEEAQVHEIVSQIRLGGECALYLLDQKLGMRSAHC